MIKNVIFDIGKVLISFNRDFLLKKYYDGKDYDLLKEILFEGWERQDEGSITVEEYKKERVDALPEHLKKIGATILDYWEYSMYYNEGMMQLVQELKEKGYKLYILSNMTYHFIERDYKFPLFKEFDGIVYSAPIKLVKPDPRIFEYLLTKYNLNPEECIFTDDIKENLATAARFKIHTFHYQNNTKELRDFILSF